MCMIELGVTRYIYITTVFTSTSFLHGVVMVIVSQISRSDEMSFQFEREDENTHSALMWFYVLCIQ